jgi:DNA-binding transcriptional regulator YdaS (Cro superfamily)
MPYKQGVRYEDLIQHFGSQANVARALDVRQPSVWEWKKKGIPAKRQLQIERITSGALKAHPRVRNEYRALLGRESA